MIPSRCTRRACTITAGYKSSKDYIISQTAFRNRVLLHARTIYNNNLKPYTKHIILYEHRFAFIIIFFFYVQVVFFFSLLLPAHFPASIYRPYNCVQRQSSNACGHGKQLSPRARLSATKYLFLIFPICYIDIQFLKHI